jgi:hypothetical protein
MEQAVDDETTERPRAPRHIDAIIDNNTPSIDESREVEVNRTEKWGTIGVPLFLTPEELKKQGIDPETTDKVVVQVRDGFVLTDSK